MDTTDIIKVLEHIFLMFCGLTIGQISNILVVRDPVDIVKLKRYFSSTVFFMFVLCVLIRFCIYVIR